jgi:hypothetical protein
MITLEELASKIRPDRTILLMGAGAAASSGAPTSATLARSLASKLDPVPDGDDLMEIAGIYENRRGRRELAEEVGRQLRPLKPAGALIALAGLRWRSVYTTNYDQLLERAYKLASVDYALVRSNYDFSGLDETVAATRLYKIHGCISQDIGLGHQSRMLLTERDYDVLTSYRETMFRALQFEMTASDTLIVGSSLRDVHLREMAKEVSRLHETSGINGQVYMLAFSKDADRAQLLEQKGIQVSFGNLENLVEALLNASTTNRAIYTTTSSTPGQLPPELATVTLDVSHAVGWPADPVRLFNGSSATYGDVTSGLTIQRDIESQLLAAQDGPKGLFLVLTGVAGVGKTSLARRLMHERVRAGAFCWEHLESFPLRAEAWTAVEDGLRAAGQWGYLLVDDCVEKLAALNKLADTLGEINDPHLKVIVTANSSQWQARTKSPVFFGRGRVFTLSRLSDADIEQLVNLVEREPRIEALVERQFAVLTRGQRIRRLRDRCSSEMYVCLKNIFGSELLDDILLREYAELGSDEQDVYRYVAVLQAMGAKVHRQLILRLLGIEAGKLRALLVLLEGIVDEYDIDPAAGLYGWAARHDVIAEVIARYKFSTPDDLHRLLKRLIAGLNPSVRLEIETARAICIMEWGIRGLPDADQQVELYRELISILPGERIPRRRLVKKLLDLDRLDAAARHIQASVDEIGMDTVIERYRVYLTAQRAEKTIGILDEDRVALLNNARSLALKCIERAPRDRHNYYALGKVTQEIARRTGDFATLDDAIQRMRGAEQDILDPEMAKDRRRLEQSRRTLQSTQRAFADDVREAEDLSEDRE